MAWYYYFTLAHGERRAHAATPVSAKLDQTGVVFIRREILFSRLFVIVFLFLCILAAN